MNIRTIQQWAPLVPELTVTDIEVSLRFYRTVGFSVRFEREEPPFAYLDCGFAQLMIEQDHQGSWNTAPLEYPFGRGVNLQIEVPNSLAVEEALRREGFPIFRSVVDTWYQIDQMLEEGQREILVHDPDGYLLRFSQPLGSRRVMGTMKE